ncbi:NADPH-dependent FMN reductase [Lacisediminihabitans changchengi]|uniref:NAD(P)H-dependent oxidoreductase n=1 Tax=Lacisediminihabitans changchengi TaxID=2787634 RepID=A0A934W5Q7_9MICO|nr:NAD(P)H-dependent oxidoreductase [Lacisediminihabitans changchengi]MBK4348795.1 NAD(P)H-dependent oxidoreductase [Lacisediminihabitans changchengi]
MNTIMIIVGSVRPGRLGLPIAKWVEKAALGAGTFDIDFVDLAELALPFMDEPNHPRMQQYTHQHTREWSARVAAANGFIFVAPEYNHSYSPALKNALDYLAVEWWRKPAGFVTYGGVSAGTRGVVGLEPVLGILGLVRVGAELEIPLFNEPRFVDGEFVPTDKEQTILSKMLHELESLTESLKSSQE